MTDLAKNKVVLQEEEVQRRASISESFLTRMGSTVQFNSITKYNTHRVPWNGFLAGAIGLSGLDGFFGVGFDSDIVGFSYGACETGDAGSTIFDVHLLRSGTTDLGSIFSTRPEISNVAANVSYSMSMVNDAGVITNISQPTGYIIAALSVTQINRGDALKFDVDQAANNSNTAYLEIYTRPR